MWYGSPVNDDDTPSTIRARISTYEQPSGHRLLKRKCRATIKVCIRSRSMMRPPLSPRSADGKTSSSMAKSTANSITDIQLKKNHALSSKDVVTRDDKVIVEIKRRTSLHTRIGWLGVNKEKVEQRQPPQQRRDQQTEREVRRQPSPPKMEAIRIRKNANTPMTITPAGVTKSSLSGQGSSTTVTHFSSDAKNSTNKYIPLRQRVREREKIRTFKVKATHLSSLSSDEKVSVSGIPQKIGAKKCIKPPINLPLDEQTDDAHSRPHPVESDGAVANKDVTDASNTTSDDTCLDAKAAQFFQVVSAFMTGAASAFSVLAEAVHAKSRPILQTVTNNAYTAVPVGAQSCPSRVHGPRSGVRLSNPFPPLEMSQRCCQIEIDEDETSEKRTCDQTCTSVQKDISTADEILNDLEMESRYDTTQATVKSIQMEKQANPSELTTTTKEVSQQEFNNYGIDPVEMQVENEQVMLAETQVIHLKEAIAAALEREKLYLTNQRYMEEKCSKLQKELDAERNFAKQVTNLPNQGYSLEEKSSSLQKDFDSELIKTRGLFGDLQQKVNQTIERVLSKPVASELFREDFSLYELDSIQASTIDDGSDSATESSVGNSSFSTSGELTLDTQGVIGNISFIETPSSTDNDIELELKGNSRHSDEIEDDLEGSKSSRSSESLSNDKQSDWMHESLLPQDAGANDESIRSSFSQPDSVRGKNAAWRWFRFPSKEVRRPSGGETGSTCSHVQDCVYDTSFDGTMEEDEVGSFDYTVSSNISSSASRITETSAEIDFQNTVSIRSSSSYSTARELDQNGSSSKSIGNGDMNVSLREDRNSAITALSSLYSGLGLTAL